MDQELREFLERQFGDMEERFGSLLQGEVTGLREEMTGIRDELREEMTGLRDELREEMTGLRDEINQSGVLVEKINDKIDLVAEGVRANTETMHQLHEISRQELREFRDIMTASHRHLEGRVSGHDGDIEQLDNRVTFLEARKA